MPWHDDLLPQQRDAASHIGRHARLLAGPGTGKTLVLARRVLFLVAEQHIPPTEIVALTFTRAAARELKQRIQRELGGTDLPRVATLHSYSLRQLLRNSHLIESLPQPLRIADDWEERNIILEHLKATLHHQRIKQTQELLSRLAADWESLAVDEPEWAPDAAFIGSWRQHRGVFGYTLRAELTYQLKRALEQIPDFQLDAPIQHLLVDEYQDLNKCDLAVIRSIVRDRVELFVAGDDDQSIYWFRKAHPEGIRQFAVAYPGARPLPLDVCMRCDPNILALAEFVAALDPDRLPKQTQAQDSRTGGEVELLRFSGQFEEATGIASLALHFIRNLGFFPGDILILLRVDTYRAYSSPLLEAFAAQGIPAAMNSESATPLDTNLGRVVLSFLRLIINPLDDLSWYQLLSLRLNNVGFETLQSIYDLARNGDLRFYQAISAIEADPTRIPRAGNRVQQEVRTIRALIQQFQTLTEPTLENLGIVPQHLTAILDQIAVADPNRHVIEDYLNSIVQATDALSVGHLLSFVDTATEDIEQELSPDKVNIITMHKAKGLTAPIVFVPVAEDEHIPGRDLANPALGDERRLLFVSLTRAKHHLFISYCTRRTGHQRQLGRESGRMPRTLTRFLRDAPVRPVDGAQFVRGRLQQ